MPPAKKRSEPEDAPTAAPTGPRRKKKLAVRTHTPRPDELSRETFEFISAIDEYKRRHMRSFLSDHEVLVVMRELGYHVAGAPQEPGDDEQQAYAAARARYRVEKGRLFPTWSEVFALLMELGYSRGEDDPSGGERQAA
jgi:hypothetical protein